MNKMQEQVITESEKNEGDFSDFVAGCDFFTERITFASGLSGNELETTILTQLEGISPFNSDQLSWGAYLDVKSGKALVYAALSGCFGTGNKEETEPVQRAYFPAFLPFLGYVAEKPCILCTVCGSTLSLLIYDEPGVLPAEVHSVNLEGVEISRDLAVKVRADLLREIPWIKYPVEESIFYFDTIARNWKHEISMHSIDHAGGVIKLHLNRQQIYMADIRANSIKRKALTNSRLNLLLWLATAGSITLTVFLLFLSGGKWMWDAHIQKQIAKVQSRQEKVASIEAKDRNLAMFESGSAARLQPLSMLDLVNRYRPDGLFFSEVKAFEGNRMQIEGVAETNGTGLVNQFKSQLEAAEFIENSTIEIIRISQGATFFRCSAEFNDLELADVGIHD
jgi:hypothetical protein